MRTRPQFGSSASASAKKSVLNRLNNRNPKYRITGRDHCPRNGQNNESIHRWMNRGFSFRWIAGIVKKKEEKEKKRHANSGEIARVNSGTERGGDGRGAGRGGGRAESGRVGSGRVGPGRRSTGRSARHARQWRAENGSGKVVAESRLVRPALPHSVQFPTVEKFSGVSTTPPLARFARCERLKTRNIREETTQSGFRMFIRNEINFSLV